MGNPYPAEFLIEGDQVRLTGEIEFTDPGNQPGGGSQPAIAVLSGTASGIAATSIECGSVIPVDSAHQAYGGWQDTASVPIQTYGAGQVFLYGGFAVSKVDTTNDDYDLSVKITVSNEDASEQIVIEGTAKAQAGAPDDTATVTTADLATTTSAGSDLSYDSSTGQVLSASGGNYAAMISFVGNWD